jgi:uncharacterized protein YecT (DUF1311 family)
MKAIFVAALVALAVLPSSSMAQDTRDAELAYADKRLNSTYKELMSKINAADQLALRSSQRAWIAFRDLDCEFGWGDRRDCLIARTEERVSQIRESLYFDKNGNQVELTPPKD